MCPLLSLPPFFLPCESSHDLLEHFHTQTAAPSFSRRSPKLLLCTACKESTTLDDVLSCFSRLRNIPLTFCGNKPQVVKTLKCFFPSFFFFLGGWKNLPSSPSSDPVKMEKLLLRCKDILLTGASPCQGTNGLMALCCTTIWPFSSCGLVISRSATQTFGEWNEHLSMCVPSPEGEMFSTWVPIARLWSAAAFSLTGERAEGSEGFLLRLRPLWLYTTSGDWWYNHLTVCLKQTRLSSERPAENI